MAKKRPAKRITRKLTVVCVICDAQFEFNTDYGRRKTCSDKCRRIHKSRINSQSYRTKQANLKAAKAAKALDQKSDRVNIYKMVHEKALRFAGVKKHEQDCDDE